MELESPVLVPIPDIKKVDYTYGIPAIMLGYCQRLKPVVARCYLINNCIVPPHLLSFFVMYRLYY